MSDPAPTPGRPAAPDGPPSTGDDLTPLDLLVFAPAGLVVTVLEDLPGLASKGRTRIVHQVRTARALGQMAVMFGRSDLERRVGALRPTRLAPDPAGPPDAPPTPAPAGAPGAGVRPGPPPTDMIHTMSIPPSAIPATPPGPSAAGPHERRSPEPAPDGTGRPEPVDLAIPGYDTLSASQVVRRLDSLGPGELAAVQAHESATRNRRTILSRVEQLRAGDAPTGPPATSATGDEPAPGPFDQPG